MIATPFLLRMFLELSIGSLSLCNLHEGFLVSYKYCFNLSCTWSFTDFVIILTKAKYTELQPYVAIYYYYIMLIRIQWPLQCCR